MTCSQVFDLCLSNEQRIGVFPFDASYERAVEEAHRFTPRRYRWPVDWSDAISRKKERKDNGCLKEAVYQSEVKKVF